MKVKQWFRVLFLVGSFLILNISSPSLPGVVIAEDVVATTSYSEGYSTG